MYARQPPDPRFPRNMSIPHNYSGNAFRPKREPIVSEPSPPEEPERTEAPDPSVDPPAEEALPASAHPSLLGSLFHRPGASSGIGSEELLLLGVLLLISQNEEKDDLLFLLILLLLTG